MNRFNNLEYDKMYQDGLATYVVSGSGIAALDHIKLLCILATIIRAFNDQMKLNHSVINIPAAIVKIVNSELVTAQLIRPFVFMSYDIALGAGEIPDFGLKTLPQMSLEIKRIMHNYLPF